MTYTISKDANYVPTTGTGTTKQGSSITDSASLTTNYSTFLGLLTAQIKNQDPLSPMDTTQWTNQLVQYSSVEQQLKSNNYLQQIAANNTSGSMNAAVSYIGKSVSADSNTVTLKDGAAKWDYNLGTTAGTVKLTVLDGKGNVVWTGNGSGTEKGAHSFAWDGKNTAGKAVADGDYTLTVEAKTSGGSAVDSTVGMSGTVTSAELIDGTVMLQVGNTKVPMSSVTRVS